MHDFGSDDFVTIEELRPGDLIGWFNSKKIALIISCVVTGTSELNSHTITWYKVHYVQHNRTTATYGCKELQSDHTVRLILSND